MIRIFISAARPGYTPEQLAGRHAELSQALNLRGIWPEHVNGCYGGQTETSLTFEADLSPYDPESFILELLKKFDQDWALIVQGGLAYFLDQSNRLQYVGRFIQHEKPLGDYSQWRGSYWSIAK